MIRNATLIWFFSGFVAAWLFLEFVTPKLATPAAHGPDISMNECMDEL